MRGANRHRGDRLEAVVLEEGVGLCIDSVDYALASAQSNTQDQWWGSAGLAIIERVHDGSEH